MNKNITLKEILKLDVKSDEFWEVYKQVSDKYWTFENPDNYQQMARLLHVWAERGDPVQVQVSATIINEIFKMGKSKSAKMHIAFEDKEFYVDIYENENQKDSLTDMLSKASKKIESGDVEIKDMRGKKTKFGKDYFNQKEKRC